MAYIDIVKPWFETGDKPTQSQFWALFDYLRFKDDAIALADVGGLVAALLLKASQATLDDFTGGERIIVNADNYYDIPAGYILEKILVTPAVDINLKLGNTVGGEEIMISQLVTAIEGNLYVVNIFAKAIRRIYFTGIGTGTQINFFKRKIN